jgi:hypothetical protein
MLSRPCRCRAAPTRSARSATRRIWRNRFARDGLRVVAGLFDSAWVKWGWAVRETELLERELGAFINDDEFQRLSAVRCEYNPKRHGFILTLDRVVPPPRGSRCDLAPSPTITEARSTTSRGLLSLEVAPRPKR